MDRRGDSLILNGGNESTRPHHAILPLDVLDQIDRVCDPYEAIWTSGDRPRIEDYFGEVASHHSTATDPVCSAGGLGNVSVCHRE
jgi:hypothetical protein